MKLKVFMLVLLVAVWVAGTARAYTREEVVKRGFLQCGVSTGTPGFSSVDSKGNWFGFDVDVCRAVAAAVFGSADKVEFIPLEARGSYTALLSGEVDILSHHSAWTFTRDSALAVDFAGVSYYDGQGFLVSSKLGSSSVKDLKKVKVCSSVGTPGEQNLKDYFQRLKLDYKLIPYESEDFAIKGFRDGACELISLPVSRLVGIQLDLNKPHEYVILSDVISKEPLGPVVREGDDLWFNIVTWSLFAMINAEELGITSQNIEMMKISHRLDVQRFFGFEGSGGKGLGLQNNWAVEIVRQVGNYGEVFERNLGIKSRVKIERGLNKLWNQGGLHYAPPLR